MLLWDLEKRSQDERTMHKGGCFMVQKIITCHCPQCGSINLVKSGHNKAKSQQAHCKNCGAYFVLEPKQSSGSATQQTILKTALERCSLRGLERIFDVTRQTTAKWIKAFVCGLPTFRESVGPAQLDDVLELDEAWSFMGCNCKQPYRILCCAISQ